MTYNPFGKPLSEITEAELGLLVTNGVAEGFWVEYKSKTPRNIKIAHSVASLANTYGGWYFLGIEADRTTNVATGVTGIDLAETPDPVSTVRDIIKSNVSPIPVFHTRLVVLASGHAVLIVHVPDGQETPFITSDGRLYRRVADSSDPVYATDRYELDRLVDRGSEVREAFEMFCKDDRTFSQAEDDETWFRLYMSPYPLGLIQKWDVAPSRAEVSKLLELSRRSVDFCLSTTGDAPIRGNVAANYDTGQVSLGAVLLSNGQSATIANNPRSAELYYDGRARFFTPLRFERESRAYIDALDSRRLANVLQRLMTDGEAQLLNLLDMPDLWGHVLTLLCFYFEWLRDDLQHCEVQAVIELSRMWRSVPVYDSDAWADYIEEFGLPIVRKDQIRIPRTGSVRFAYEVEGGTQTLATVGMAIALALGAPMEFATHALEVLRRRSASNT